MQIQSKITSKNPSKIDRGVINDRKEADKFGFVFSDNIEKWIKSKRYFRKQLKQCG